MQNLRKLLEHIVANYPALAEAKADEFFEKFKKQIEKSSIYRGKVSDEELKYAIAEFEKYKNGLPPDERDLGQWTIQELLNFLRSKPSYNPPSTEELPENAPPVVYDEGGITIFDGSNEDRCVTYGRGERWCITQGSFANYRYSEEKKYPTFYLVKDANLPKSDPKSFFVIMVGNDNTYKASDRTNNDIGGRGSEWQRWEDWSFVENHFPSVRGLKDKFKYRPIPASELTSKGRLSLEDWVSYSPKQKQSVITAAIGRASSGPFSDMDWGTFIRNVLPQYKDIGNWMPSLAYHKPEIFARNYNSFTEQQRKSIVKHLNTPGHDVNISAIDLFKDSTIPMNFKLDLVRAGRVPPGPEFHLYADKKGNLIALNMQGTAIQVIKQYPNKAKDIIDIDKEDEHYITDDPNFDKISLDKIQATVASKNLSDKVLRKALQGAEGSIEIVKDGDKEFAIQKTKVAVIQLGGERQPANEPFPDKVLDKVDELILSDDDFREAFFNKLHNEEVIPYKATPSRLVSIITKLPKEKRITTRRDNEKYFVDRNDDVSLVVWLFTPDPDRPTISSQGKHAVNAVGKVVNEYGVRLSDEAITRGLQYILGELIPPLSDGGARNFLERLTYNSSFFGRRGELIVNSIRLDADNIYKFVFADSTFYLLNKTSREGSLMFGPRNTQVVSARLSQARYNQLMGTEAEPATRPQATQQAAPPATAQGGGVNVIELLTNNNLAWRYTTSSVRGRLNQGGTAKNINNDRGSSTRNHALRGLGRVTAAYQLAGTASALYIITLNSGTVVAAIAMQPGNIHLLLATGNRVIRMRSADDLRSTIEGLNIRENNNMENKSIVLRKLIERILRENQPAPSRPGTSPLPGIAEPGTEEEEDDDDTFSPPEDAPDPRPKAEKEKVTSQMLVKRFKTEN